MMTLKARQSRYINRRQADNFFAAVRFATELGMPLNVSVDLNLSHTSCPSNEASARFELIRDRYFTRWLRYHTRNAVVPPTYVWVVENGACANIHWMVHLPVHLQTLFRFKLEDWLETVAGPCAPAAILVQGAYEPRGKAKYMMKGLRREVAKRYYVVASDQGVVNGKRCGVSENLGPTARQRYNAANSIVVEPIRRDAAAR